MTRTLAVLLTTFALLYSPLTCAADDDLVKFHRQYIDGPDGQIHVLTSRPASAGKLKTPMACFAPNPSSGRYFKVFMQVLGQDRIMIAPDYPGLGESDPPQAIPELSAYTLAMASAIEALGYGEQGLGKVDVCGYHTGAYVAMDLALVRPDLIRKVMLMGIPFYTGEELRQQYDKNVVPKPIEEDFQSLHGSWDFAVTGREKGVSLERGYDNFVDVLKAQDRRTWAYHAVFTYPAEERAPLLTQPVLILNTHGSLQAETRALAPLFPNMELIEIPELHHGIFDVGPGILADYARPFLNRQ